MWVFDRFDQVQRFVDRKELYCFYLDDGFNTERTNLIMSMKRGFDNRVGNRFHILFPAHATGLSTDIAPTVENYNHTIADAFIEKAGIAGTNLPLLFGGFKLQVQRLM